MRNRFLALYSLASLMIALLFLTGCGGGGGGGFANPVAPSGPSAPAAPVIAAAASSQANTNTITWNPVIGATSYNLYWATSAASATASAGAQITKVTSPYTHSVPTGGTTYYYVATAVNGGGESGASNVASATPSAPCQTTTYYQDADGDTYGNAGVSTMACSAPTGYVAIAGDCDDTKVSVHPGATETCNGADDNCNGSVDEGVGTIYYRDGDSDTYGNAAMSTMACSAPANYVAIAGDCDDTKASVHPGATEACNGVDDNCDGTTDNGVNVDDGVACTQDTCDPNNGITHTPNDAFCAAPNSTSYCNPPLGCQVSSCNAGFANCDNSPANGCEVNTSTDVNNCNACGTVCAGGANGTATCANGACGVTCNAGFTFCAGTGCVNLQSDVNNCSTCGNVCAQGQSCTNGQCLTPTTCGNGIVEAGEQCDAGAANGSAASCCNTGCTAMTTGTACSAASCNGNTYAAARTCDGAGTCTPSQQTSCNSLNECQIGSCTVAGCSVTNVAAGTTCNGGQGSCNGSGACI